MPILSHIMKIFGKEDIIFTCRFCQKTGSKSIFRAFHGYECIIKPKKVAWDVAKGVILESIKGD